MGNRKQKKLLKMKRMLVISSAVSVVLTIAVAGMPIDLAGAAGAVRNTGVVGANPAVGGSIIAFFIGENQIGQDLNGDGDMFDPVIRYYDTSTGQVTDTGAFGSYPAVGGSIIAFVTGEFEINVDLNGDGDMFDPVIRYYDISTGLVTNTGAPGYLPAVSGSIIAFFTYETDVGQDLNGDADTGDAVIRYYDTLTGQVTNTGAVGAYPAVGGSTIAFTTYEYDNGGEDLNGDGDTSDAVIRYYDTSSGQVTNTGVAGEHPSASGSIIAFHTWEFWIGQDLNGDSDTDDFIVRYYDISTDSVTNTNAEGFYPAVSSSIIAFQTPFNEMQYYDIAASSVTSTGALGYLPDFSGSILSFLTPESWIGEDLNGDGDTDDQVIRYFTASNNMAKLGPATLWIGLKNSDDQGTRFDLRAEVYINDALVAAGETLCITGVTKNPSFAREVSVPFNPVADGSYVSGDTLSLRLLTRIGTTPEGRKCPGHNNAAGLRLYYDGLNRASRVEAEISPDPVQDLFLDSSRGDYFFNDQPPTGTAKYKDSSGINFKYGNPWKEIGTWSMELQ